MPTKSEVIYQRALHFRQLVSEVSIKLYEQKRFAEIVNDIFNDVFKDEVSNSYLVVKLNQDEWDGDKERRDEGRDRRDDYNDNCTPM